MPECELLAQHQNPRVPGGTNIKIIHNGEKRIQTLTSFMYGNITHPHNTMENTHNSLCADHYAYLKSDK